MGEDHIDITKLKMEINNLVWMYGDKDMPLKDAERIACDFLRAITNWEPGKETA
jgi:hypothetical protein